MTADTGTNTNLIIQGCTQASTQGPTSVGLLLFARMIWHSMRIRNVTMTPERGSMAGGGCVTVRKYANKAHGAVQNHIYTPY